jgi:uncharacterized protein YndB with AHSA1/START domain
MSATDSTTLRLRRTYDAPREEVFDAWTNPEVLRRWWSVTPAGRTPVAEVDLRVGGCYRLTMEDPEAGTTHTVRGEYREVLRPERLVYSWCWVQEDGSAGHVSTVTVEFVGEGERTTVVLEHSELESPESAERHSHGWKACMRMLDARIFAPLTQAS